MQRNLSEAYDVSPGSSLTKFNLTKYRTKSNQLKTNNTDFYKFKDVTLKQPSCFNTTKKHRPSKTLKHFVQDSTFQTLDFTNLIKKRKIFEKPQIKVHITSQSEKQLIQFMNPQSLPKIQLKNRLKQSSIEKIMKVMKDQKKLKKFTQKYFDSLEKANKSLKKQKASQQFPQIKVLGWSVRGYKLNDNIILKAVRFQKQRNCTEKRKVQKYKKISNNNENMKKIEQNYEQFVKEWLYLGQAITK